MVAVTITAAPSREDLQGTEPWDDFLVSPVDGMWLQCSASPVCSWHHFLEGSFYLRQLQQETERHMREAHG